MMSPADDDSTASAPCTICVLNFNSSIAFCGLAGPHTELNEIIEFEKSYLATLIDGKERVINFPFDPLSFMKAIGEGRKPHKIYEGNYELVIEDREGIANHKFHHQDVVH